MAAECFSRVQRKSRPKDASDQPLRLVIDLYLTDLVSQNEAPSYVKDARRILEVFHDFLAGAWEREPVLRDFTTDAAIAYALYAQERKCIHCRFGRRLTEEDGQLSSVTVRKHLRQIKVFSSWLSREEWTKDDRGNPVSVLQRMGLAKAIQKDMQPLTREEETKLFKACDDRSHAGCRRLAIVGLFLDTGTRLNELAGIRIMDVDFALGVIRIQLEFAKGRKGRTVSFGKKVERALKRYGMVFRDPPISGAVPPDSFFLNPYGRSDNHERYLPDVPAHRPPHGLRPSAPPPPSTHVGNARHRAGPANAGSPGEVGACLDHNH